MLSRSNHAGGARRALGAVSRRQFLLASAPLAATALGFLNSASSSAAEAPKGVSSRSVRDEAVRSIPMDQMAAEQRARVAHVINNVSIFRRMPVEVVDCEPALFHFLVCNPEVVVNMWHLMGVTNVTLDRLDATRFRCADGDGTTARGEFVFGNHDTQIIYAEGFYDGPLFPRTVRGKCVAVLKMASLRETNDRFYVTARLDTFLLVENIGVELVAKTFQGMVGRTADHNFAETVAFLGSVSRTAETNPQGMRRLAGKLTRVEAPRREEFAQLTEQVQGKLAGVELAGGQQ